MATLPFIDDSSGAAAVVRPTVSLSVGAPKESSSGFGGVVDAVSSFLSGGPSDPWKDHLLSLRVKRHLAPQVDVLEIGVAAITTAPAVALKDEATLSLGDAQGKTISVFKGDVTGIVDMEQFRRRVMVTNAAALLAQARRNQSFSQQSANEVLDALAAELGITIEITGDGPDLPRYVADDGRSLYEHMARLAAYSGRVVCVGADNSLKVKDLAQQGDPVASFAFGVDILAYELAERSAVLPGVQITGEGAAGDQGSDAWSWLRKDPVSMQAHVGEGEAKTARLFAQPALRSSEGVKSSAQSRLQRSVEYRFRGVVDVVGTPGIEPGDIVKLSGIPASARNGSYRVISLVHELALSKGFVTRLEVVQLDGAGGSLSDALLGAVGGLL